MEAFTVRPCAHNAACSLHNSMTCGMTEVVMSGKYGTMIVKTRDRIWCIDDLFTETGSYPQGCQQLSHSVKKSVKVTIKNDKCCLET